MPWLRPANCGPVRVPVTLSLPLSKVPSEALIGVPVPSAPTASMKYSAAATLLVASVSSAVTVGDELVGV